MATEPHNPPQPLEQPAPAIPPEPAPAPSIPRVHCPACKSEISTDGHEIFSKSDDLVSLERNSEILLETIATKVQLEDRIRQLEAQIAKLGATGSPPALAGAGSTRIDPRRFP